MIKLSAIVLTKNEEKNIERCLQSLDFCDEIIIVDDNSNKYFTNRFMIQDSRFKNKIKLIVHTLNGDFAKQRNFAMEKAGGEWLLFIDADEEITPELKEEIEKVTSCELRVKSEIASYRIKRRDFFWGRELRYGEIKKLRDKGIIRLVKKNSGKWTGKVHEQFKVKSRLNRDKVQGLNSCLNHYPHQTTKEFLETINFYSSLRAKELYSKKIQPNILQIIFYPLGKFIYTYFIMRGFLDGTAGFVYAFFMSFHSFLVRAKLFQYYYNVKT